MKTTKLLVSILLTDSPIAVGELVYQHRCAYFQFDPAFLDTNLNISPFKLPLGRGIIQADSSLFDGMFGVFNDSLPDGWGRLLLDRALVKKEIDILSLNPLDRLAFVGKNGMGALRYEPSFSEAPSPESLFDLDQIARETQKVLTGTPTDLLDTLFSLGGSSGGARPKITVGIHHGSGQMISDYGQLPEDFESWLIKFPSSSDLPDIAQVEHAYYLMAKEAGIEMSPSRLFHGRSGKVYFGTKRFDRNGRNHLHMHSASGLLHDNFRLSSMDYGHLMDAAFRLEKHFQAYEKILRLAAFNVFAYNRDDHSKNFSFLMDQHGSWTLSPAYDLTFSQTGSGHHSTTVAGEGENPGKLHLRKLADIFSISQADRIIEEVQDAISQWTTFAQASAVSQATTQLVQRALNRMHNG